MNERFALVVDDHPTNRLLGRTLLGKMGWNVTDAESGELALELASKTEFSLILLDISMPGLSGEDTCTRLRAMPNGAAMRIIAYTAHAFPEERERFLAVGFDEILVKPINRQRLEEVVGNH
jgi:CheY-like chemotaxis protein